MILFKWGTRKIDDYYVRWVLNFYHYPSQVKFEWKKLFNHAIGIELRQQVLTAKYSPKWLNGAYWDVGIFTPWYIGTRHAWYDGPRHTFSLGFLHFNWMKEDCKKCENDDC